MIIISSDWKGSRIFHFNNQHQHCIWTDNFGIMNAERMMYIHTWWSMIGNTHINCFFFWQNTVMLVHNEGTDHKKIEYRPKMVFRNKSIDLDKKGQRKKKQLCIIEIEVRTGCSMSIVHRWYWFLQREF